MMMQKKEFKSVLKKVWYFIWEDDSVLSWIVNIILAFVIIKFLVYPGLGLALDTSHPIVAVVSGSMEHKSVWNGRVYSVCGKTFNQKQSSDFDTWWDICKGWYEKNTQITKSDFKDFKMHNGFNTGDIIVLLGSDPENIKIGDIIVFRSEKPNPSRPDPIIHRVVKRWQEDGKYYYQTKGDHNEFSYDLDIDELRISQDRVIGKAWVRLPFLGWIKIGAVRFVQLFR